MYAATAKACKMNLFKAVVQSKVLNKEKLPVVCKIILNNNKNVYNPGNEILGHVEINFNEEFVYYGVKLVLEGIVHVKYREDNRPCEKRESILTESNFLLGEGGKQKIRSKPGTNSIYPFTIEIPATDVPGSFRGTFGSVNYRLILYMDYGENKLTKKAEKQIIVNGQLDLDPSSDITHAEPVMFEKSYTTAVKQVKHNKTRAEPSLKFLCTLEQRGFISGENITFELELENPKNQYTVKGVNMDLVQRITYHVGNKSKQADIVLATTAIPPPDTDADPADFIPPNCDNPWKGVLEIPKGTMPSQHGIIEFEYFFKVTVTIAKTKDLLTGECPITMGTTRDGISADGELEGSSFYSSKRDDSTDEECADNEDN